MDKEALKITVPNTLFCESFKWCLEYLKGFKSKDFKLEAIQKDYTNLKNYLEAIPNDGMGRLDEIVELTNRMVGSQFAIKAIKENKVDSEILSLIEVINKIEKEMN